MDSKDTKTVKERIEKADRTLLRDTVALRSSDLSGLAGFAPAAKTSRDLLIDFASEFDADWSHDALLRGVSDSDSDLRYKAAEILRPRARRDDAPALLEALEAQSRREEDDLYSFELLLAIGNTRNADAVEPLMVLQKKEKNPEILLRYHMALAKLGFVKETRKLRFNLEHGPAADKASALRTVRYIGDAAWVPAVVPLLTDDEVARHTSKGPATFRIRVCDEAVATLGLIDPDKKISFEVHDIFGYPFSGDQIKQARAAYGLPAKDPRP